MENSDTFRRRRIHTVKHRHHQHARRRAARRSPPGPTVCRPDALPTNVEDLQQMVIALQHQVLQLQRMLFGRRSERVLPDDPAQDLLFGRIDPAEPAEEPPAGDEASSAGSADRDEEPAPRRRRANHRGRRPLPAHLMRCVHDIHPPEEERICPSSGHARTVFGADVTDEPEMIPARFFVNR